MVVDTSVWMAILRAAPGAEALRHKLLAAQDILVPASAYLEACMVAAGSKGPDARAILDALLASFGARVVALTPAHANAAAEGFLRYGKGRHGAALNFGDCMSYGTARAEGLPLLWAGADFAFTDAIAA